MALTLYLLFATCVVLVVSSHLYHKWFRNDAYTYTTNVDDQTAMQVDSIHIDESTPSELASKDPGLKPPIIADRTQFRMFVLRKIRQRFHIDDFVNNPVNRKVIKRNVVKTIKSERPDIRDVDLFLHADIITEMFFIPLKVDLEVRRLRFSSFAMERRRIYKRPIWIGSMSRFFQGLPLSVDPEEEIP